MHNFFNVKVLIFFILINCKARCISVHYKMVDVDFDNILSPNSFPHANLIVATTINFLKAIPERITTRQLSTYDMENKEDISKMWIDIKCSSTSNESLVVFLTPVNEDSVAEIIEEVKIIQNLMFGRKPTYLIVWPKYLEDSEESGINTEGLSLDSDVYILYKINGASNHWKATEIYSLKSQQFEKTVVFQSEKIEEQELLRKSIRRNDFEKIIITSVYFGRPQLLDYQRRLQYQNSTEGDEVYHTLISSDGDFEVDIYKFFRDSFNFTERAIHGTGFAGIDGDNLTGIASQINNEEADIAITSSELLPYRVAKLAFLHPTHNTKIWAYFVQPPSSTTRDVFLHSFNPDLWLAILSTWFLIALGMILLAWIKSLLGYLHENDKTLWEDCFLWATGTFCQQGWYVCPESSSMKILFIFGVATGLLSYIAYSAALVSMLSTIVVPIRSVEDLVYFNYFIYRDDNTHHTLDAIKDLEMKKMIPTLAEEERIISPQDVISKLYNERCSFFGVPDIFYYFLKTQSGHDGINQERQICEQISKVPVSQTEVLAAMFLKKGSPLRESFNHRLNVMNERGIRFRLLTNYFRFHTVQCLENSAAQKESLGFRDVFTAFIILIVGYCLSISIFIIERFYPPKHSDTLNTLI